MSKHAHDDAMTAWHRPQPQEAKMEAPFKTPVHCELGHSAIICDARGDWVCSTHERYSEYITAAINAYASAKLTEARLSARSKTVIALRENLSVIVYGLEDEGDRVYFGSSNDADELRLLYEQLKGWEWAAIAKDVVADDPYEAARKAYADRERDKALIGKLVEALLRIANGEAFEALRHEGEDDADYFLRVQRNVSRAALAAAKEAGHG